MRRIIILTILLKSMVVYSQTTYTFIGNGFWTNNSNWSNNTIPPSTLPNGSSIVINSAIGDTCILNVNLTISPGGNLTISPGAFFLILGGITITGNIPYLTTNAVTSISENSAISGGNIIANNGSPINVSGLVWSTMPNPTINLPTKTTDGSANGNFNSNIQNLQAGTTYYVKAYASNNVGTGYGNEVSFTTASSNLEITICSQVWMGKNLDVRTYRNGDPIPQVTDYTTWSNLTTGAWCWYNNDSVNYSSYGKLYNWYAVNDPRGLAPQGWHVPSESEWNTLAICIDPLADTSCSYCSMSHLAGGAMKEVGFSHWISPNVGATNSTGFTALPGGYRDTDGSFDLIGYFGAWWSSVSSTTSFAWFHSIDYNYSNLDDDRNYKKIGFSIRCIKD